MKNYRSYKHSGVEWIGEIPESWGITKIKYSKKDSKDSFIDGDWIESRDLSDVGIRYITSGNIGEGKYKEQGSGYISEDTFNELNCTEIFEGDLLISRLFLPIGRSCILPNLNNRVVTCVDNVVLRPKETFNKYYLNYQFNSIRYSEFTELISRGVTLTRISRGMLGNNSIVVPPLLEQNQIVQFLDEKTEVIDKLISTKERKITLLKEQRTSLINQVVTKGLNPNVKMKDSGVIWIGDIPENWKVSKLGFYTTKIGSGSTPKGGSEIYPDSGIPFIRSQNVHFYGLRLDDVSFIDIDTHISMKGSKVIKNDVLLNITGGSIGRCCIVDVEGEMNVNQHVSIIRTTFELLNFFLNYILSSDLGQSQVLFNLTGGNREGLTIDGIRNFRITLPPINEQKQIVEYLDSKTNEIDDLVSLEQRKIDTLKEYRQSLVSEVVTGKIKVTID